MQNGMNGMGMGGMNMPMAGGYAAPPNAARQAPAYAPATPAGSGWAPAASPTSAGADDFFQAEEATDTVSVTSIRPWVGTVKNTRPDNWAALNNATAPDATLALDWIYGMNCQACSCECACVVVVVVFLS